VSDASVRRFVAEATGTAWVTTAVIGAGIMATRLTPDTGLRLLLDAIATAGVLFVAIELFAPMSGAQLNPIVTLVDAVLGRRSVADVGGYVIAQVAGAVVGAVVANLMFALPAVTLSTQERATFATLGAEVVATAGLVVVIFGLVRQGRARLVAAAVAVYIASAYVFTSSTSFANPAITVARALSDTFAGIAPTSALAFIAMQLLGATVGLLFVRWMWPSPDLQREDIAMEAQS